MDPLTKVGNRVKLERYMEEFFQRDYRRGTLMIFDLDNFKTVNDIGGHPTGDKVLKCFADYLRNHFRQQDLVIRIGGDEFAVFMENKMPLEVLLPKLDRLRNEIEIVLDEYRKWYGVSVSIGIAFVDDRVKNFKEVYRYADVALYIAKRQGKNQYYINENNINCIRDKCINCTENCERRKMILKDKNKK